MLRLSAQAVIVVSDGRGAPAPLLVGGKRRILTGTIDHDGPFRQRTGSLMLFTAILQAYSSLGSEPAGPRSGESRTRTGAASRGSDHGQRAVGLGPPTRPVQATGEREDSHYGGLREVHRRRAQAALPAPD